MACRRNCPAPTALPRRRRAAALACPVAAALPARHRIAARRAAPDRARPRSLHQRLDARVDRGMRGKQVREAFARIVDAHLHHGGGRGMQFAAILDLAQRRDHGVRVLGQFDRARVGEKLALARQREADHDREKPRNRDQRDRDHDRNSGAALAAIAVARTSAPTRANRRTCGRTSRRRTRSLPR